MRRPLSDSQLRERMDATKSSVMRQYYRRILNGLCATCNYPPVPGRRRCEVCELKNGERVRRANV